MSGASAATAPVGPLALLFGGVACVACLNALAFAVAAVFGASVIPSRLLEGVWGYVLSGLFLVAFGVVAARGHARSLAAVAAGDVPHPYWHFHPGRAVASFVLAAVGVSALALATQLLVNSLTSFTYTILWGRTMPFIAIAVAWVVHGEWNRRAMSR